jgi:hypothetical protein
MTIHGKNGGNVKPLTHCGAIRLHIRAQAEEEPMSMMLRWSEGASRVELDQQAREERLRLEEAHREFTVEPSPEPSRFERVLRLFGAADVRARPVGLSHRGDALIWAAAAVDIDKRGDPISPMGNAPRGLGSK